MTQRNEEDVRVHISNSGFTIVQNDILRDPEMSLKAKGLLIYMLSLPPDWDYSVRGLIKVVNPVDENGKTRPIHGQSRDGIYKTLQEIEACGYLIRSQPRNEKSGFMRQVYNVFDRKQRITSSEPLTDFPDTEEPCTENPTQISTEGNGVLNETNTPTTATNIVGTDAQRTLCDLPEAFWVDPLGTDKAAAVPKEEDPDSLSDALRAARSTSGRELPAEILESIEDEAIRQGFQDLIDRALKPPAPNELRETFDAYRSRIESGTDIARIASAYESYITRYWADASHDSVQYALRLPAWFRSGAGIDRDLMLIGLTDDNGRERALEHDRNDEATEREAEDAIRAWLTDNDERYAAARTENERASKERSRFPVENGFGDEAMARLNDPDTPFNAMLRETQQTMDSIFLARKDEAARSIAAQTNAMTSE